MIVCTDDHLRAEGKVLGVALDWAEIKESEYPDWELATETGIHESIHVGDILQSQRCSPWENDEFYLGHMLGRYPRSLEGYEHYTYHRTWAEYHDAFGAYAPLDPRFNAGHGIVHCPAN